jgi:hypothetical protein
VPASEQFAQHVATDETGSTGEQDSTQGVSNDVGNADVSPHAQSA